MSITRNFRISLKLVISKLGVYENITMLKGKSDIDEDLLLKINNVLQSTFVPVAPVRTTVAIGDDAEQKVMHQLYQLSQNNIDFEVVDKSNLLNHGDMMVVHMGKRICIEVKCYTKPVPMKEVDKYRMSLNHTEYDAGIMIQMGSCGFTKECAIKTPIDFKLENGKPSIYLTDIDLSIIYPVINMLISYNNISNEVDIEELEKKTAALISIHEEILTMRVLVEQQKKLTKKIEDKIDDIIKLTL